ncbi:MAG: SpoIID/LytB domain-containing protein [Acidobacteriaceae bacterium]
MKARAEWGLWLAILPLVILPASLKAATAGDGGGRDVSVALFSTRALRSVTVTPLGSTLWVARCVQCKHETLSAPLHITGPMEIFAGGTLRVTDDATGDARTASGLWHLRANGRGHEIDVVLTLPSERYVAAVLNAEAAPGEPAESLRALAILARTYALNGSHFTAAPGHLAAELCDSTECQAMRLETPSAAIEDATNATAGETLWFGSRRAEVFFSQNCGGLTEDAGAVWPKLRGVPYLRSHADPYCIRRDTAAWHTEIPLTKLAEIERTEGWHMPANIVAAKVTERSQSHRALRVVFTGNDGASATVSASALRFGIGRALGWDRVRSDAYELAVRNGALTFDGHGHGHGVGLCQEGAAEMAAEGKGVREILAFYFPGTAVGIAPGDGGWEETRVGAIAVRATQSLTAERRAALEQTWSEAQKRFPPRHSIAPEVVFAPTTEIFRQLTAQPGWVLACTRADLIVLQPDAVMRAHGRTASAALLHEMLHVLVEAEAGERAPLWLREGLVEALAGETAGEGNTITATTMSVDVIEGALAHANSLQESERAHRAAAERVRALIARYGFSTVRGWLSAGVPAGVE